jgi:hypothetical protein
MLSVDRLRANHALRWLAVLGLSATALVCALLPSIRLGISGYVGAGAAQRTYDFDRDLALVPDLLPHSLVLVVPAALLLVAAAAGIAMGSRSLAVVVAAVAGVALLLGAWRVDDSLAPIERGGVLGCDRPCAGFVLQPAVRALHEEALRTAQARQPGFAFLGAENGYRARGLGPWAVLIRASVALALMGGFALARVRLRPLPAAAVVAVLALLVWGWLVLRSLSGLA